MAHARVLICAVAAALACGGTTAHLTTQPPTTAPVDPFTPGVRVGRFHSVRFSLSLPLPDGARWRIDDHRSGLLRATHAPSRSKVELVLWHEDELMNHEKCEARARDKGFGERAGDEVDHEVAAVPTPDWDAFIWLGTEGDDRSAVMTAHLFTFAASIRKCFYFHFSTEAARDVISDRLAYARLRILRDIRPDTFDVPRTPLDLPSR